jgi:hypothetical protein
VATHRNRFAAMVRRGRRFESVRGLCKPPHVGGFGFQADLLVVDRAVGVELWMENALKGSPQGERITVDLA